MGAFLSFSVYVAAMKTNVTSMKMWWYVVVAVVDLMLFPMCCTASLLPIPNSTQFSFVLKGGKGTFFVLFVVDDKCVK